MAIGHTLHVFGVVLVIAGAGLMLVSSIGAPVINDIGLLKVTLKNASDIRASSVVFGPFGYCVLDVAPPQTDQDYCPKSSIGYVPAQVMYLIDPATGWKTWTGHTLDVMTVAYVLFPISCGFAFLAAAFAICGVIGHIIAAFLAFMAWVCAVAVMIIVFISMGDLKDQVIYHGLHARYGIGLWTCLAGAIVLFFAMLFLFFSCCTGSRGKRKDKKSTDKDGDLQTHDDGRSSHISVNHHEEAVSEKQYDGGGYTPAAVSGVPFSSTGHQTSMKSTMRDGDYKTDPMNEKNNMSGYVPAAAIGAVGAAPREKNIEKTLPSNPASTRNSVTHHLPTHSTTTSTYRDKRGGFSTEMHSTSRDHVSQSLRPDEGPSRSASGPRSPKLPGYTEDSYGYNK